MKVLGTIFLALLLTIFGSFFLLQTPSAKGMIKKQIVKTAQKKGVKLSIGKIEGDLPLRMRLIDVQIDHPSGSLFFEKISLETSLFPLFKKKIDLTQIKIKKGEWNNLSFEGLAKATIDLKEEPLLDISYCEIEGEELFFSCKGLVQDENHFEGEIDFSIQDLSLINPIFDQGQIKGKGTLTDQKAHLDFEMSELIVENTPLDQFCGSFDASYLDGRWFGLLGLDGKLDDLPIKVSSKLNFSKTSSIELKDLLVEGPFLSVHGDLSIHRKAHLLDGKLYLEAKDLSPFRPFLPNSYLSGQVGGMIEFISTPTSQECLCQIECRKISLFDFEASSLCCEVTLSQLFGSIRGELFLEGAQLASKKGVINHFEVKSVFEKGSCPFSFSVQGSLNDPLQIEGAGSWHRGVEGIFLDLEKLSGYAYSQPFSLKESMSLEWKKEGLRMGGLSMDVGKGSLHARFDLTDKSSLVKIRGVDFPLEWIPLPKSYTILKGTGTFDLHLLGLEDNLEGRLNIALERAYLLSEGKESALMTKGSLQAHLNGSCVQVHCDLKGAPNQYLEFCANVPIIYSHFPFRLRVDGSSPIWAQLTSEGNLEDFFRFINIGHHKVEGGFSTKLTLNNTLSDPNVQGEVIIQDGLYENYHTGTHLEKIEATAKANGKTLLIEALTATDGTGGKVQSEGSVNFDSARHFPFTINSHLKRFDLLSFDTIAGTFSGDLTICGDRFGSLAQGKLRVSKATFKIPDTIPSVLPDLLITFINPPEAITRAKLPPPSASPMKLDIELDVPKKAFVIGRGIESELKGKLHISGTHIDVIAKGELKLLRGEFVFAGKVFDLTEAKLIFKDKPTPSAYISIQGNCQINDFNVTAILQGPLSSPKLSFQSNPQMATSDILSHILFDEDVLEITAAQAIQLAQSIVSLSGSNAPDLLQTIRKTLGIDRLTIASAENDPAKIAVQIGKYLAKGVMLTYSQGAVERNVALEVDLKKGIRLQAKVDQDQQGKISLKWHHNY